VPALADEETMAPSKYTVAEIIDLFGGTSRFAFWIDSNPATVSTWRNNGIPPGRCLQIHALAVRCGLPLTLEQILRSTPHSNQLVLGDPRRVPQTRSRFVQQRDE
jgi:hypothetical protein